MRKNFPFPIFHFSIFIFALGLLSCGRGDSSFDGRRIVVWETYANEEHAVFEEIVRDFEAWYSSKHGERVQVAVKRLPFDQHIQKIKFSAIMGTAPDIARVDAGELIDLVYGQVVYDLRKIDPNVEEYLASFTPPARESVKIPLRHPDGQVRVGIYGIPDQITGVAVYYNRALLRAKGFPLPPKTLKEMASASPKWDMKRFKEVALSLSNPEKDIFGLALNSSLWFSLPFFNSHGADFIQIAPDGTFKCVLDSDSGVAALTALADLYWSRAEAGAWLPGAIGADRGFINGKYAMIVSGPWNLQQFKDAGLDFGVALIPEGPNVREIPTPEGPVMSGSSTNVGGTDMAILKTTKEPKLCYEFLKYLTSPEVHAKWCNKLGQIPVQTLAEKYIDFSKQPELPTFMDQMRTALPRPKIPRYGVLEGQIMVPQIERAFGSKRPEEVRAALQTAVKEMHRRILDEVNVPR